MSSSRIPSPARSQKAPPVTPRRYRSRATRSVGSPARSDMSGRLSSVVDEFKRNNQDSIALSPLDKTVLSDNTEIEMPKRKSWWKKVENSREIIQLANDDKIENPNLLDELDFEVLSQEKKNYTFDIPDSSDSESIRSIIVPQRRLFTQKENVPHTQFGNVMQPRKSVTSTSSKNKTEIQDKTDIAEKTVHVSPKKLFGQTSLRPKPVFPAALFKISPDKTLANKTKELPEIKNAPRKLFGNRLEKRNIFADFILSESEDEIPDIQPRHFAFQKPPTLSRRSSAASKRNRDSSPTSSMTTDTEMEDWKLLPSSTMVEHQLEAQLTTPGKRTRLSKLSEVKESINTNSTKLSDKANSSRSIFGSHKEQEINMLERVNDDSDNDKKEGHKQDGNENELHNSQNEVSKSKDLGGNVSKVKIIDKSVQDEEVHEENVEEIIKNTSDVQDNEGNVSKEEYEFINKSVLQDEIESEEEAENKSINEDEEENGVVNESEIQEENESINNSKQEDKDEEGNEIINESEEHEEEEKEMSENEENDQEDEVNERNEEDNIEAEHDEQEHEIELQATEDEAQDERISQHEKHETSNNRKQQEDDEEDEEDEIMNESKEHEEEKEMSENDENDQEDEASVEQDEDENGDAENDEEIRENVAHEDVAQDESIHEDEEHEDEIHESVLQYEESLEDEAEDEEHDEEIHESVEQDEEPHEDEAQDENINEDEEQDEEQNESERMDVSDEIDIDEEAYNNSQEENNDQAESHDSEEEEVSDREEQEEQQKSITELQQCIIENSNDTHDTTGRNRKKPGSVVEHSPEAILHEVKAEMDSFTVKGRNTSIRKTKSILKNFTIRPSEAPPRESTGFSDGTDNSSAAGSGWDSHRTTRRTLRQTFGKDFTPRKSLRALVMEKSAKRQTIINEANANLKFPQANSTELHDDNEMDVENVEPMEHEVSLRTRQTTLDMVVQRIQRKTMEWKLQIEENVLKSLKPGPPVRDVFNYKGPSKITMRRANTKPSLTKPKKRLKPTFIDIENLPPELAEDMKYKPPKRFCPRNASWVTKRLYKSLETKLEPRYGYKARVRAEKFVETLYTFVQSIRRERVAPTDVVNELKKEMARLDIIATHFDFYNFFRDFLPKEVKLKVVPDLRNNIELPREGVFSPILLANEQN